LLITPGTIEGTIGGGHLEFEAIQIALAFLKADESEPAVQIRHLVLGQDLRQCCGGAVQLWLERFTPRDLTLLQAAANAAQSGGSAMLESDFDGVRVTRRLIDVKPPGSIPDLQFTSSSAHAGTLLEDLSAPQQTLWIFGAGHVGQAIVRALSDLPFDITWVDSRPGVLPTSLPANVCTLNEPQSAGLLAEASRDAMYLVLTHDHALDYSLCHAILQRDAFAWLGLIGSKSKAASFRSRLRKDGIAPALIEKLVCPIGVTGIESKAPAAIAIAVAAQLLQTLSARTVASANPAAPLNRKASRPVGFGIANIKAQSAPASSQGTAHDCGKGCDGCSGSHESVHPDT
jgi:xanthine dehydrogenase accessory factor